MPRLPALFVSHGAPTLAVRPSAARRFLQDLGDELPRPQRILCVSAHWESAQPSVNRTAQPETIHDFFGFSDDLYRLRYPAPGAPDLAEAVGNLVENARVDDGRGLDHGAWVPLMLMYPDADIPVCQLSVQPDWGTAEHLALGEALRPLRDQGVLILGSGGAVHDLRHFTLGGTDLPDWAQGFEDWLVNAIEQGDRVAIAGYRADVKSAVQAHPTEEHFLPLAVAMGAGSPDQTGRCLHRGFEDGALSMAAFLFE